MAAIAWNPNPANWKATTQSGLSVLLAGLAFAVAFLVAGQASAFGTVIVFGLLALLGFFGARRSLRISGDAPSQNVSDAMKATLFLLIATPFVFALGYWMNASG